ncbi:MAG: polyhydroxybutyrate depolymerase [Roseibium sp.]|nr:polyhydroxybutyrate depolymerase [Roseibium sp.]
MKRILIIAAAAFSLIFGAGAGQAEDLCAGERPCELDGGQYYIHLPDGAAADAPKGAIFFLHGHRGSALKEIRKDGFKKLADDLNVAFVAVQGVEGTWSFPTAPRNLRDEFAFFDQVLDDVAARFGVDRGRTMLSGFSSGGFMTWYLACENAGRFSGYAPIAGAFWKPLPASCETDTPFLFHIHGTKDTVVPLEGRPLGGGRWHQGDVFDSFKVWQRQVEKSRAAIETYTDAGFQCERWTPATGLLELCLHDGGHSIRAEWLKRAWQELAKARGWG